MLCAFMRVSYKDSQCPNMFCKLLMCCATTKCFSVLLDKKGSRPAKLTYRFDLYIRIFVSIRLLRKQV